MISTTLAVVAATLSFGPAHGNFSVHQARQVANAYEQQHPTGDRCFAVPGEQQSLCAPASDITGRLVACSRQDRHDVQCNVRGTVASQSAAWTDVITRSGGCSNAGRVISRHNGITVQDGGHHFGNCFTGPLVVVQVDLHSTTAESLI